MRIPRLNFDMTGPNQELERHILAAQKKIEHWFHNQWHAHTPPFYGSVDLRNSGFKLAPVDMNMFPGGFNNLSAGAQDIAVHAAKQGLHHICPAEKNILLIPENHTRNLFYLQNVSQLQTLLKKTGANVRIGTLNPEITEPTSFALSNDQALCLEPIIRRARRVCLANYDPNVILLNNDLSSGLPDLLQSLEQPIIPPLQMGWFTRKKTQHFAAYDIIANLFADMAGIDPWQINPYFEQISGLEFQQRIGGEALADSVHYLLGKIRQKYKEYHIQHDPFVVVKANSGTYGMGVITIKDAAEITRLNRKQRNKMAVIKEGVQVSDVIVQEGVYTCELLDQAPAEPVIYMIDRYVTGGFYRTHSTRRIDENLNAPGMDFVPFVLNSDLTATAASPSSVPVSALDAYAQFNRRFYVYTVIARLSLLASAIEIENIDQQGL